MELVQVIWPIPGPVAAALIAGFISFVVTVLAKDQKTSEFRQAWIDGLRSDTAEFSGAASAMASVIRVKHRRGEEVKDMEDYLILRHDDFAKMEALNTRIRLRLNPTEHVELIILLRDFSSADASSTEEIDQKVAAIVAAVHKELGLEWRRVKRGEPSFRILKWISSAAFISVLLIGFVLFCQYLSQS